MTHQIFNGEVLQVLPSLADNSFAGVFCDPPYGLSKQSPADIERCLQAWTAGDQYAHGRTGFMGAEWDAMVPGPEVWREVFRVLKPGARLAAFAGTRTQDLMALAIELAGFEYETTLLYSFGSGFPKAQDIGKHLDAMAGAVREVGHGVGGTGPAAQPNGSSFSDDDYRWPGVFEITAPATDDANLWDGYKTPALKPAYEPLLVFRKPGDSVSNPDVTQSLFFGAKASARERNAGLGDDFAVRQAAGGGGGIGNYATDVNAASAKFGSEKAPAKNPHPTLKSIAICQSMARQLFAPGGSVLVPFSGSGSEMIALRLSGFDHAAGIEQSAEYVGIAEKRLAHWLH